MALGYPPGYNSIYTVDYTSPHRYSPVPSYPTVGQYYTDTNSGSIYVWDGTQWHLTTNNYNIQPHNYNIGANIVGNDISIINKKGRLIYVGEMIDRIMARLGMIDPDQDLMEKYPAVKAAYEEYEKEFALALARQFPDLKAAIDSYNMMVSLVKADDTTD